MQLLMLAHRSGVKRGRGDTRPVTVGELLATEPHFLEQQDMGCLLLAVNDKESVVE
jgi:hypothetical protein